MAPERRGAALAGGHLGLAACTERVEAVGGTLELVSEVGAGTEVRATIPVAGRRDGGAGSSPAVPAARPVAAQGFA
jgi:signal transduction histidine kinase